MYDSNVDTYGRGEFLPQYSHGGDAVQHCEVSENKKASHISNYVSGLLLHCCVLLSLDSLLFLLYHIAYTSFFCLY